LKIAVPLQTRLCVLILLLAGFTGCQQEQQSPPKINAGSVHSHTAKKEARIVVPPFVAGKWKGVRMAVIDKTSVSQKVYTIPVGGNLAISSSGMNIKVEAFLPAFIMEGTIMTSSSNELTNPGVKVQITENGVVVFSGWIFSKFPNTHAFMHPRYGFTLIDAVPAAK
jgi:hypothetical protein